MTPVYISATLQHSGKTAIICGLLQVMRDQGLDVGYFKPVGQKYVEYHGAKVDKDAVLVRETFGLGDAPEQMSPIIIERGYTERYIFNPDVAPLEKKILSCAEALSSAHEGLLVEGTGHAGVGACIDLSNARVAQLLGAGVIIITTGGIGRPIDEVALSLSLFREHGVRVLGVIVNKVLARKYDRIKLAVARGLENLGTKLLGAIPVAPVLVCEDDEGDADAFASKIRPGEDDKIRAAANMVRRHVDTGLVISTLTA